PDAHVGHGLLAVPLQSFGLGLERGLYRLLRGPGHALEDAAGGRHGHSGDDHDATPQDLHTARIVAARGIAVHRVGRGYFMYPRLRSSSSMSRSNALSAGPATLRRP